MVEQLLELLGPYLNQVKPLDPQLTRKVLLSQITIHCFIQATNTYAIEATDTYAKFPSTVV